MDHNLRPLFSVTSTASQKILSHFFQLILFHLYVYKIRISKSEIRNKYQIRILQLPKQLTESLTFCSLFEFLSNFDIRISNFRVVEEWVKFKKKINMRKCHYLRQNL